MPHPQEAQQPVDLDVYTLAKWGMEGSGYLVALRGEIDDLWADCFGQAQHTRNQTGRFYLDRKRRVLVFSVGSTEDPKKVLGEARALLSLANWRAGRQGSPGSQQGSERHAEEDARPVSETAKKSTQQRLQDTRSSSRVDASLMVEFGPERDLTAQSAATGMTHDLSESGVFIVTSRLPAVGERLNLKVHLASQNRIEMTADVVRVLEKEEARQLQRRVGFAARITDPSGKYAHLVALSQS
jgi:c-di-GMP-binding flagellar brake protein YcgR